MRPIEEVIEAAYLIDEWERARNVVNECSDVLVFLRAAGFRDGVLDTMTGLRAAEARDALKGDIVRMALSVLVIHAFTDAAVAMNCGTFEQAADRKPAELEAFLKTYIVRLVLEEQDS